MIAPADARIVRGRLRLLDQPVRIVHVTHEDSRGRVGETAQLLEELVGLGNRLNLELHDPQSAGEILGVRQIDRVPATAILGEQDHGIFYFGMPRGFEFPALIEDVLMVSRRDSGVQTSNRRRLEALEHPIHVEVFVTPSCPYCPSAVRRAHQLALASDRVRADMIETSDFPELAERHGIHEVPTTMINGKFAFRGLPEEHDYVTELLRRNGASGRGEGRAAIDA